jgi:Asp-tRNA(Asn)/Glu-tRNA(Gln) amidotransferase A subunit family amidase
MAATAGHSVAWRVPEDLLGAFCRVNHVALEPTGRGPLDGLAFAVKDVFHIAGHTWASAIPSGCGRTRPRPRPQWL